VKIKKSFGLPGFQDERFLSRGLLDEVNVTKEWKLGRLSSRRDRTWGKVVSVQS